MILNRLTTQGLFESVTGLRLRVFLAVFVLCFLANSFAAAQNKDESAPGEGASTQAAQSSSADSQDSRRDLKHYESSIKPLLKQACYDCHGNGNEEGNFRADELDPDLVHGKDIQWWLEVYSVLSKEEMPPADSNELSDKQRATIVDWLASEIQAAEKQRKASSSRSSFRRLTRYEYNYALQDLLGVPWSFAGDLPAEASEEDAFENNAESLHMSVKQVETYHELALKALQRITVRGERPPVVGWSISMESAFQKQQERHAQSIESLKKKFEDDPEELAEELKRLVDKHQASADKSHYLDSTSGQRVAVSWNYRKAKYAFEPRESDVSMPETGTHFAVLQPGRRQSVIVELGDQLQDEGFMRVRVRASRAEGADQRVPSMQLAFGFRATDQGGSNKQLGQDVQVSAVYGQPEIYEWYVPLSEIEHRNTYRGEMKLGDQPNPSEFISFRNTSIGKATEGAESSAILIDHVEVDAPVYRQWPSLAHRSVFFESENSHDETVYAKEVITAFMSRAWRQSPTDRDVDRKLALFKQLRPISDDFQQAVIEVLATVLTSPKFIYVMPSHQAAPNAKTPNQPSQHELATRLSLFLWCSQPDEILLDLATKGRLNDVEVLQQQVERMLADPRAARFSKHFVGQWLKMQPLEFLNPTRSKDGLDAALLKSMKQEPIALFADMLKQDSNVLDFVDADYLVVNERLAEHYGIQGVLGNHFRRVALPAELNRGGLLTQAGLLTMNSSGEDSHPVKRGVWLLTSLLNDPPPPPPAAVPEIDLSDPEIAKLTLKERIEDHRNSAACLSCHQKIDPWGIAFENYDALGRWRDQIDDKVVDASSVLPNKVSLDGINGLKKYLVEDRHDQFFKATVEKMAAFALGRQLGFEDREAVKEITKRVRESGGGVKTMVICLVTSELFQLN